MNNSSSQSSRDWKEKYLAELDKQERRERQQQQLMELLMRAVVRISLVADGIDQQLDKQLAGLRNLLREGMPSGRDLDTMVNALEGQVKRLDVIRSERAKVLVNAFKALVVQLKTINSDHSAKDRLKRFNKNLKTRSTRVYEYSALINEYASVQQEILQNADQPAAKTRFWQGWFAKPAADLQQDTDNHDIRQPESEDLLSNPNSESKDLGDSTSSGDDRNPGYENDDAYEPQTLDLSDEQSQVPVPVDVETDEQEPPFKRLSKAICSILSELLQQIEPPIMAKQNYYSAKQQVANGLNWYELVPTLEDISIVVVSAFDSYQKEFEQFLLQLDQRLGEAHDIIFASEQVHVDAAKAGKALDVTMREQVSSMRQSVASATDLEQLKSQVSVRLDDILAAMDRHNEREQQRETSLSDQLHLLIEKVKIMEKDSADAEARIEEQRQRALRDVLTQLPNREAYLMRLEQEFERWQRYSRPLSLMVCDIDYFKRINDTYGHLAGDKVLKIVAKSLIKRLRKTDFVGRYGGEEFVVLMPETLKEQALKVAEGMREAIANCPFHFKEEPVSITLSFGITEFVEADNVDSAFIRADKALYVAKDSGRNCCVLAELPGDTPMGNGL